MNTASRLCLSMTINEPNIARKGKRWIHVRVSFNLRAAAWTNHARGLCVRDFPMKIHSTPLRPKPEHLAQIERILGRIRPDDEDMSFNFIVPEIERRAIDLWLVERFIPKSARVADVG